MTITVPKPVLLAALVAAAVGIGVIGTLLATSGNRVNDDTEATLSPSDDAAVGDAYDILTEPGNANSYEEISSAVDSIDRASAGASLNTGVPAVGSDLGSVLTDATSALDESDLGTNDIYGPEIDELDRIRESLPSG